MGNRLKAMHAVACLLVICGCKKELRNRGTGHPQAAREVPQMEWTIELTGSGLDRPTTFTYEQLASMKMTRLENLLMQKTHEPDETTSWQGPALEALLAAARIKPGRMTLTLQASDGYEFDCTRADLQSAIVALQDGEGRWLAELDPRCPLRLVPPAKPGNYWIMNLSRITVEPDTETALSQ